jgi:hypothetical protein
VTSVRVVVAANFFVTHHVTNDGASVFCVSYDFS